MPILEKQDDIRLTQTEGVVHPSDRNTIKGSKLHEEIEAYIAKNYVELDEELYEEHCCAAPQTLDGQVVFAGGIYDESLDDEDKDILAEPTFQVKDLSFHAMLFQLIEEREMDNVDIYKAANMSKQLFSKIKSNPDYAPSKKTIVSLAIALKLDLEDTNKLLMTEGYVLTNSLLFDIIVQYFIENKNYSILDINDALWEYGFEDKDLFGF